MNEDGTSGEDGASAAAQLARTGAELLRAGAVEHHVLVAEFAHQVGPHLDELAARDDRFLNQTLPDALGARLASVAPDLPSLGDLVALPAMQDPQNRDRIWRWADKLVAKLRPLVQGGLGPGPVASSASVAAVSAQ